MKLQDTNCTAISSVETLLKSQSAKQITVKISCSSWNWILSHDFNCLSTFNNLPTFNFIISCLCFSNLLLRIFIVLMTFIQLKLNKDIYTWRTISKKKKGAAVTQVEPASCYLKVAGLHVQVSLSRILNPKLVLLCWSAPCMAVSAMNVCMNY